VKAKSSVSSHDQSKHSKNQSQTDASVWNRVVSPFPQFMVKFKKHRLYVIDLIDENSIIFLSSQIDELLKVSKQTLSRKSTRPKNAINRIITPQVNQKLRTAELNDLKNLYNFFCLKNKQHDPRHWRKNRSKIHEA
jgi:hypothetical protein